MINTTHRSIMRRLSTIMTSSETSSCPLWVQMKSGFGRPSTSHSRSMGCPPSTDTEVSKSPDTFGGAKCGENNKT